MSEQGDGAVAGALGRRQKVTADVMTRATEVTELEDGYELHYPRTAAWREKLDDYCAAWSKSCPNMSFLVQPGESGPLVLRIRGPEGTKAFVEGARYMLTSHFNPAPTLGHKLRVAGQLATSPLRSLPDFLIIGAKKCGTTALYSYLTQHPRIVPALKKEIYFFNAYYQRGTLWYRSHFPTRGAKGDGLTGEATPDYLYHPHCAQRIRDTLPQVKLLAILRNPVDRAYSFYNHNLRAGLETLTFEEAVASEEERLAADADKVEAGEFGFDFMHHSYLSRGIYVDQLKHWEKFFPREQLHVLRTEDLYERPEEMLRAAFAFLGLDYHAPDAFKKLNAAPPYPEMEASARARIEAFFEPHNRRLGEYLGRDMGW